MADERMDAGEDPLDELRWAWKRLSPPRPDSELDDADAPTRAAVAWMQAAWSRVEAPVPVVPLELRLRRSGGRRWAQPLAAAAGVLVALGAWLALQRLDPGVRPGSVDTEITAQGTQPPPAAGASGDIELAALSSDRVELRSGPVRLILLTPESPAQPSPSPER